MDLAAEWEKFRRPLIDTHRKLKETLTFRKRKCKDKVQGAKAYLSRVGFALRGSGATQRAANVTALAIGAQLPFAKALLARDARGNTQEVRDLRGEAEQRGVERPSRRRGRAEKEEGW